MEIGTANFATDVPGIFEAYGNVDVAVAFVSEPGLALVRPALLRKLESGNRVRILLDLEEGATDPTALWELVTLNSKFPSQLLLKTYIPEHGILHSKVYIAGNGTDAVLLTGSANLSGAALLQNVEHGLRVVGTTHERVIGEASAEFEELWESQYAFRLDEEAARLYEIYSGLRRAALTRRQRRARGLWQNLKTHLTELPDTEFDWPSTRTAFVIGAITARGYLDASSSRISIPMLFNPNAYKNGRISVLDESFDASEVLPTIPQTLADNAKRAFPAATVTTQKMTVDIDFQEDADTFRAVETLFAPQKNCKTFLLPKELSVAEDSVVAEFVRGFAVASALLTDSTSMPGNKMTGLPGQMVVWLRPKQGNPRLYNQLDAIITRRLHITAYRHQRTTRDPALKLLCEEFQEIGFGIDWWDQLLRAASEYNQALFPQPGSLEPA